MIPGMEQAIATFVNESKELLAEMEDGLLELEESLGDEPDGERINAIFRAIHTIKGSAGIFGFDYVVELTHIAETILDQVRDGSSQFDTPMMKLFLQVRDLTDELVMCATQDQQPDSAQLELLGQLTAKLRDYQVSGAEPEQELAAEAGTELPVAAAGSCASWHISFRPKSSVFQDGLDPLSFIRYLGGLGEIRHIHVLQDELDGDDYDPELCYLGFEISLFSDANRQQIADVFEFIHNEAEITILPPASAVSDYIDLIKKLPEENLKIGQLLVASGALSQQELDSGLARQDQQRKANEYAPPIGVALSESGQVEPRVVQAAVNKQAGSSPRIHQSKTLRVEALKLDRLIDQVGEMVITGARTNLLAHETGDENLIEAMALLERLVENIRDSSLKLRMVQIGETFNKFKRVVRDVAEDLGKQVHLEINGAETELDKTFIEKISDPLMHIVRNAIDHGIEMPEERRDKGKEPAGTVVLNSYHDSGSIVIEVSDDGKGINKEKIRSSAVSKGLITEGMVMSDKEIYGLIFEPGFSTAAQVTNISGRGVGMDVVKRNIDSLRGTVEIDSELDKGSRILIRLPLTLSIIDGFMFEVDSANYVIPLDTVVECIELHELVDESQLIDKSYINLRGEVLPFVRLRGLFGIADSMPHERESLVVVQFGSLRAGVVVDSLKGEFQTVVKPLGRLFEGLKCISGATILGSGDVAVILDVSALIESAIAGYEKVEAERL